MTFRDVRLLPDQQRAAAAATVHAAPDVDLPVLRYWNYQPCAAHTEITPGCPRCGVLLRRHQRIGAAWLYLAKRGLLADSVGLGKSAQIIAVLAMMCETGEISDGRSIIICRAAAVGQWRDEINRMVPALEVITANGTPAQRRAAYARPWHVCVLSPNTLAGGKGAKRTIAGDIEILREMPLGAVVFDDTDAMRNPANRQAYAIKKLCDQAPRAYGVHGTPLQKRLTELWSFLEPVGGRQALGSQRQFQHRYVKEGAVYFYQAGLVCPDDHLTPPPHRRCQHRPEGASVVCGKPLRPDPSHRKVLRTIAKEVGILPSMVEEFKGRIAPLVLRRKAEDVGGDVTLPAIQPSVTWLDPTPAQRRRYDEIKTGVLRMLKEEGEQVSHPAAMAKFLRAWQCCSGLAALDGQDSPGSSAKLDWVMDKLAGDLSEEKVVTFVHFKPNISALSSRLEREHIGHVIIWGAENSPQVRQERLARFRDDPACRVLLGTTSIEQSLNLQVARHMICVDVILNPARMEQLSGRVRRMGSAFTTVFMHMLLLQGTMETGFLPLLEREQALADTVWDESSDLFDSLSARQLLELVAGRL